jgi:hypothetical protein
MIGLALTVSAFTTSAQDAPAPPKRAGGSPSAVSGLASQILQPGPAWRLTPKQRAARQQQMQATLSQLRAKRNNGTITPAERAWLERVEQAGGLCVNDVPRGGGFGLGQGPRNGTGPRAHTGSCPLLADPSAAIAPSPRGRGFGRGQWAGHRAYNSAGWGLRNGTGPRSLDGACPLLNPPPSK